MTKETYVKTTHLIPVVLLVTMLSGFAFDSDAGKKSAAEVKELLKGLDNAEITFSASEPCNCEKMTCIFHTVLEADKQKDEARAALTDPESYSDMPITASMPAFALALNFKNDKEKVHFQFQLRSVSLTAEVEAVYGKLLETKRAKAWNLSKAGVERLRKFYAEKRDSAAEVKGFLSDLASPEIVFFKLGPSVWDPTPRKQEERKDKSLHDWPAAPVLSEKAIKDETKSTEIRAALTDPRNYAWVNGANRFNFKPEFVFRFNDGDKAAEFVVSLTCGGVAGFRTKDWLDVRGGKHDYIESKIWELSKEGKEVLHGICNEEATDEKANTKTEMKPEGK